MMLISKKFSTDLIWNVVSLTILGFSGIIINILIAHYYGPEELGIFNQVFAFYIVLSQFSVLGIHYSVLKHVSYNQENIDRISAIVISAIILCLALASVFAFFTYISRELIGNLMHSSGVGVGLGLVAPGLVGFAINKVLFNMFNGLNHMRSYAVFQALRYLLILVGVVLVIVFSLPGNYLAGSLTFAELVLLIVMGSYTFIVVLPVRLAAVCSKWFKEHLSFGARGFLSGALTEINTRVDVLTIGFFLTDKMVGIYSFAAIIAEGFSQLSIVVRRNVDPLIGESFSKNNLFQIQEYSKKIKRIFPPLMIILAIAAVFIYPIGLDIIVKDTDFNQSLWIFGILMIGVTINTFYRPFSGILLQGDRPGHHTLMVGILVVINFIGNIILIPILGILGAAIATACAYVLEGLLIKYFSKKLLGINL